MHVFSKEYFTRHLYNIYEYVLVHLILLVIFFFIIICLFYTLATASPSSIIYFISGETKINFPREILLLNGKLGFKPS